jgi:hypothetical protein
MKSLKLGISCLALLVSAGGTARAVESGSTSIEEKGAGLNANVHVNLLGPLQFGLTPTVELGGQRLSGLARFRWMNPGLLSQGLANEDGDESLGFSYGLGLGSRYYLAQKTALSGVYFGAWLEYLHTRIEDTEVDRDAYVSSILVPQVEGGYRFRFGALLVGAGAAVGYAKSISTETEDLSGGQDPILRSVEETSQVYGSLVLDVGVFF